MKTIKGYEGKYFADENGNIYSNRCRNGLRKLKPQLQMGYHAVDLGLNGKIKRHLVHRLVAMTYIENHENKPQVNHINGDKLDNRLGNLEWNTSSENMKHSIDIGLRHTKGEKNSQCKLDSLKVMSILESNLTLTELSKIYNVSVSTICNIKTGYSWTHVTGLKNTKNANRNSATRNN